jgi:hypothetical protein
LKRYVMASTVMAAQSAIIAWLLAATAKKNCIAVNKEKDPNAIF